MNNDNAKLRRYEDDLNVSGKGVIIMGFWSVIKTVLEFFYGTSFKPTTEAPDTVPYVVEQYITFLFILFLSVIVIGLHLYIGRNAMNAAVGKPHKKGYLIATIIVLVILIAFMPAYTEQLKDLEHIDTTVAAILVDLTTAYLYISVIRSTLNIRKLKADKTQKETP